VCVCVELAEDIEFDEMPDVVAAVHGGDVLLPCVVRGEPPPAISWRFGRRKITLGAYNNDSNIQGDGKRTNK